MFGHSQQPGHFQAKRKVFSSCVDFSDLQTCPWLPPAARNISWQVHHTLPLLINTEYFPFNNSKPRRHPGPWHCVFKGQPCPGGVPGLISSGYVVCCPVEVPQPQGSSTGLQIPWGAPQGSARVWKGPSESPGDEFSE